MALRAVPHNLKFLLDHHENFRRTLGQAALSLVLLIGGLAIFGTVALVVVVISFLNSSFGFQAAQQALASASSGVNDALLRLDRDGTFSSAGYCVPYATPCATTAATVLVTQNAPHVGEVTIISDAKVFPAERKVQAIVSVNSQNGQASLISWQELTL